ncbi:hypothetical protein GCM10023311_13080 [Flaviramulus aquimarinus]|uniref:CBM-cenC domain-containing protein n=1 Tax=Flaviramulus aquimarinus TaxID=1170456 RepID=A0ABP9F0K7_9FLAO
MKTNYFNALFFVVMLFMVSIGHSQNVLTDGDFSVTTDIISNFDGTPPANVWSTWQATNVDANAVVVNNEFNYQIRSAGNHTYEVQLVQAGFSLVPGHSYKLSFDVKADANRAFGVFLGEHSGNWTNLIGSNNYRQYATTDWRTISIEFDVFTVFPYHKLSFELGSINTRTFFDNVILFDKGVIKKSSGSELNTLHKNISMQGFRPESSLGQEFINSYKESKFIVYPTISRSIDTTTWSKSLSKGFAENLKSEDNLNINLNENSLDPGELKGESQYDFFNNDMERLGNEIKLKKENADYYIIPEIVFEPKRQGTLFVFGIHIFILNNAGENVFSFLLNSHHEPFLGGKLYAYEPDEKELEALKKRSLEVGIRVFKLMVDNEINN